MAVDRDTVSHIGHLARIALPEHELAVIAEELSNILTWIEQLDEVDTSDVAPMRGVENAPLRFRADEAQRDNNRADILANAPLTEHGFFAVPKVIE